ncbi:MAG: aspartate aminotransferase family protein [Planctomycetota bacterium]
MIRNYVRAEEVFVHGKGAMLVDENGREYLDAFAGIAVNALGHAHPALTNAISDQAGKVLHLSNLYRHPYTEKLAGRLAKLSGMAAMFFTNSGTEAVELALKLAIKRQRDLGHGERDSFVALENSFHGRSCAALSTTSTEAYREPFSPLLAKTEFIPAEDLGALRAALSKEPAALILEPIQGEGGLHVLSAEYLQLARKLCDDMGTLLIHDEIQCGCGRTGSFLCADQAGVKPDMVTLAKPLAGGLPMGAMLVRDELAECIGPGDHGSTFAGGPLVCRAALVLLDELEGGLQEQVVERGAQLRAGLDELAQRFDFVLQVRGMGLMQGLQLDAGAAELRSILHRMGLLVGTAGGEVLRILPPYVITAQEIEKLLDLLGAGLTELQESRS